MDQQMPACDWTVLLHFIEYLKKKKKKSLKETDSDTGIVLAEQVWTATVGH